MRFLIEPREASSRANLEAVAFAAHAAGLDGVLLKPTPALPAPLVAAAAVAGAVDDVLVAAEVALGDRHPLQVAEEAAVVDVASGGRLVLVCRPAAGAESDYAEALDLVRTALAPRPFAFAGRRWRVPALLPGNEHSREERHRLTPSPAQARLAVWGAGGELEAACERGLGYLDDGVEAVAELGRRWDAASGSPASIGAPRARRTAFDGDWEALVAELHAGREALAQDWAVVAAPAGAVAEIGVRVRPRVALDRLPEGLDEAWRERDRRVREGAEKNPHGL